MTNSSSRRSGRGAGWAVAAYGLWGILPLYWRYVNHLPSLYVLAHRVVWAAVFFVALTLLRRNFGELKKIAAEKSNWAWLALTATLIGINWGVYIHCVITHQLVQASLGYFLNPLVNVALGLLFLGEKLSGLRKIAVALAAMALVWMIFGLKIVPSFALVLAFSFGFYGLFRKRLKVDPWAATTLESLILAPASLGLIHWYGSVQGLQLDFQDWSLVIAGGVLTALPLYWFSLAAKLLPLSTLGLFQYLSPSLALVLALTVLGEAMPKPMWGGFILIWIALALHSYSMWQEYRSTSS